MRAPKKYPGNFKDVYKELSEIYKSVKSGSKIAKSNQEPFKNHASSSFNFRGFDPVDNSAYVDDATGGLLRRATTSDNWQSQAGATWSANKGWPTGVTGVSTKTRIIRFGAYIYLLAIDTTDSLYKIWRATPTTGDTALTWSSPLHTFQASATALFSCFDTDGTYLYAAEYTAAGTFNPRAYRSADGVTWETIITEINNDIRHFHGIAPDPYNPGHVYLTCGDGIAKTNRRSKDYGATWTIIEASSTWQAVQISFTEDYVYFAGDSQNGIAYKMDRNTLEKQWISPWLLKNIPVPAPVALGDAFYNNAWLGVVDPNTGDYYASINDASVPGNIPGLLLIREGEAPIVLLKPASIESPIYIAGGVLWCGKYRKILNQY